MHAKRDLNLGSLNCVVNCALHVTGSAVSEWRVVVDGRLVRVLPGSRLTQDGREQLRDVGDGGRLTPGQRYAVSVSFTRPGGINETALEQDVTVSKCMSAETKFCFQTYTLVCQLHGVIEKLHVPPHGSLHALDRGNVLFANEQLEFSNVSDPKPVVNFHMIVRQASAQEDLLGMVFLEWSPANDSLQGTLFVHSGLR